MNPKKTLVWLALAAGLFAFIFFFERNINLDPVGAPRVLPGLKVDSIRSVQVQPKGQLAIHAVRTNGGWILREPVAYPANSTQINALLESLAGLTASPHLSAQDLAATPEWETQFGFVSPQFSLMLDQKRHLVLIGNRTPTGDRVYLQVVGVDAVFVVDAGLLRLIPQTASPWRETSIADWAHLGFNRVIVTNASKLLELQLNAQSKLWRMLSPNDTRADSSKVRQTLDQLPTMRAQEFVSDDPAVDLESFGLQPPELSLTLLNGTNTALRIDFGKSPTNNAALVYARRADQHAIVTVPKAFFESWSSAHTHSFRDFFDPHLLALPHPPDQIEIQADEQFTLSRGADNIWRVTPPGYSADSNLMVQVIANFTNLQVTPAQIEKDVVPAADLPKYGLTQPFRKFTFRANLAADVGTNMLLAQLEFGTNETLFARVQGESFVYRLEPSVLDLFPSASWQMRDRRIWSFSPDQVASLTIEQGARTRKLLRKGDKNWTLAPGSQGIIDEMISAQLDESIVRLGDLSAAYWVQHGGTNLDAYGFKETAHRIAVELKTGEVLSVQFGKPAPSQFPYASTTLDNETWVFEFPWTVYQFVQLYLTLPAGAH